MSCDGAKAEAGCEGNKAVVADDIQAAVCDSYPMTTPVRFHHPEPMPFPTRIWPVFLPFAGCPYRCLFCAQDKQTGQSEQELGAILSGLETDLASAEQAGCGPYELAFYGGTFTALPAPWPERFLALGARFRDCGLITRMRCSTRPDCVSPDLLARMSLLGLDMVELGIQSFDDRVLHASGRGYSGTVARYACAVVQESGMALGIQLLPGLPGDRPGVVAKDVRVTAGIGPEIARLYPCLVIRGTGLVSLWERGEYEPWTLERARQELAKALSVLWRAGVRVIRLGLPPEGVLAENILAGPWHPALGQSVRGLALADIVRDKVAQAGRAVTTLDVPRRYQGEILGHAKELAGEYAAMGLGGNAFRYIEGDEFILW